MTHLPPVSAGRLGPIFTGCAKIALCENTYAKIAYAKIAWQVKHEKRG